MRLTIIVPDSVVIKDGVTCPVDLSQIDPGIHAVQWYDTWGEIEWKDNRGRSILNEDIESLERFEWVLPLWEEANTRIQEEKNKLQQRESLFTTYQDLDYKAQAKAASIFNAQSNNADSAFIQQEMVIYNQLAEEATAAKQVYDQFVADNYPSANTV